MFFACSSDGRAGAGPARLLEYEQFKRSGLGAGEPSRAKRANLADPLDPSMQPDNAMRRCSKSRRYE